jgi:hypothetical protein
MDIGKKILTFFLFFSLFPTRGSSLTASASEERRRSLFPHIADPGQQEAHARALRLIRTQKSLPSSFVETSISLDNFYFCGEGKRKYESTTTDSTVVAPAPHLKIPLWVEAVSHKNWKVIRQLLRRFPSLLTEKYGGKSFCQWVFEAGPSSEIMEEIIETAETFAPEFHPFLGTKENPHSLPFSYLHPSTESQAAYLCMTETLKIICDPSSGYALPTDIFYENKSRLCAYHLSARPLTGDAPYPEIFPSPFSAFPHFTPLTVLIDLIREGKYQGFTLYFYYLATYYCRELGTQDKALLIVQALQFLITTKPDDAPCAAKMLVKAALEYCRDKKRKYKLITSIRAAYEKNQDLRQIAPVTYATVKEILQTEAELLEKREAE